MNGAMQDLPLASRICRAVLWHPVVSSVGSRLWGMRLAVSIPFAVVLSPCLGVTSGTRDLDRQWSAADHTAHCVRPFCCPTTACPRGMCFLCSSSAAQAPPLALSPDACALGSQH